MIQARGRGGDDMQRVVGGSRKGWGRGDCVGDEGGERKVEFVADVGSDSSAERGYVNAIQPDLQGSSAETRAKNSNGTDRQGSGAQRDFRRRAEIRRSADSRAVDRRSLHTFDVNGLNIAKPEAGERAAARVQRQDQITDGLHGHGSEDGDNCRSGIGGGATYQHSGTGKADRCEAVLAGGDNGGARRQGRSKQRYFLGLWFSRNRGIGKGLEGHFGRADL